MSPGPLRKRIIAALGCGTVFVEAAQGSGTIATARHAVRLGRTVMAVPGRSPRRRRLGAMLSCAKARLPSHQTPRTSPRACALPRPTTDAGGRLHRCSRAGREVLRREGPASARRVVDVVRAHTARLREIVSEYGWPGRGLVGEDGADAAWLLLQHANSGGATIRSAAGDEFCRSCVALLREAVAQGEAHPRHLAAIADSLRMGGGDPPELASLPGHQYSVDDGGRPVFRWDVDVVALDRRRAAIGLCPLADDIARFRLRLFYGFIGSVSASSANIRASVCANRYSDAAMANCAWRASVSSDISQKTMSRYVSTVRYVSIFLFRSLTCSCSLRSSVRDARERMTAARFSSSCASPSSCFRACLTSSSLS
jgi:hypothetical protein